MNRFASSPAYLNGLPPAGQTTVYVAGDAGTYQLGISQRYEILTTGQYSGTTAIVLNAKTDTHSNGCVIDHQYKLMWNRTGSATVGTSGALPWTTNGSGEGIFTFAAAANAASLSGYTDWRIPLDIELLYLRNMEAPSAFPDATAFPAWPTNVWSSVTQPNVTTNAYPVNFNVGNLSNGVAKTNGTTYQVVLVRSI